MGSRQALRNLQGGGGVVDVMLRNVTRGGGQKLSKKALRNC